MRAIYSTRRVGLAHEPPLRHAHWTTVRSNGTTARNPSRFVENGAFFSNGARRARGIAAPRTRRTIVGAARTCAQSAMELPSRAMWRAALCALLILAACRHDTDPSPMRPQESDLPPLPPSSGTPVGYLVDNAAQLNLRDDQITKLKQIDQSLSARDAEIDTQLRMIEKPADDPETAPGAPPARHNNAPGAQIKTTPDAAKLHDQRNTNDR